MGDNAIENFGIYNAVLASVDMVKSEDDRFYPVVTFLISDEESVENRGVGFTVSNSFPTVEYAYWDTRVNLENLGFVVDNEILVFDDNGDQLDQISFDDAKQEVLQ